MTKKFVYGAKPPHEQLDSVRNQLRLVHRYQNNLVALEIDRRAKVEAALQELFPRARALEQNLADAIVALADLRLAIGKANSAEGKRRATAEEKERVAVVRARVKELRAERKALRAEMFASEEWKARQELIDAENNLAGKKLRAECGCYWGTYQLAEIAMERAHIGPLPRFKRWDGCGMVSAQIMGGMTVPELLGCEDTRAQLHLGPDGRHGELWLRVGSTEDREPVWAKVRVVQHRPLPPDGNIRRVYIRVVRVGTMEEWSVMFDVVYTPAFEIPKNMGAVGIDLGWRKLNGSLRVAYWVGGDGQEGELRLPFAEVEAWRYTDGLESIRDTHFGKVIAWLADWRDAHKEQLPEWFRERTATLRLWKAQAKLASLAIFWRTNRFAGDTDALVPSDPLMPAIEMRLDERHYGSPGGAFDVIEAWRKKDKHLCDWAAAQRMKLQRRRDDLYRNFARTMARSYEVIKLEDCNWAEMQRNVPQEQNETNDIIKTYMRFGAVGTLRRFLIEAANRHELIAAAKTTMVCHKCGQESGEQAPERLVHRCGSCGAEWDQDRNAALNLLASAKVVDGIQGGARNATEAIGCDGKMGAQNHGKAAE